MKGGGLPGPFTRYCVYSHDCSLWPAPPKIPPEGPAPSVQASAPGTRPRIASACACRVIPGPAAHVRRFWFRIGILNPPIPTFWFPPSPSGGKTTKPNRPCRFWFQTGKTNKPGGRADGVGGDDGGGVAALGGGDAGQEAGDGLARRDAPHRYPAGVGLTARRLPGDRPVGVPSVVPAAGREHRVGVAEPGEQRREDGLTLRTDHHPPGVPVVGRLVGRRPVHPDRPRPVDRPRGHPDDFPDPGPGQPQDLDDGPDRRRQEGERGVDPDGGPRAGPGRLPGRPTGPSGGRGRRPGRGSRRRVRVRSRPPT